MENRAAVYLTWEELFGQVPTENEVFEVIQNFNRQSTVVLLARLGIHMFLDQFRRNTAETVNLQSFLIANFWDDDVLSQAKKKFASARLDFRRAFHLQQILTLLKWTVLHALATGGVEPDTDRDARFALGRSLLKTSDLLLSTSMRDRIARDRRSPSLKRYLRAQLQMGAGLEINNPPPVVNGVARSETIFGEILQRTPTSIDLTRHLKEQTGIPLDSYIDLTLGALAIYLCRNPKELIDNPGLAVINPNTFFGSSVSNDLSQKFWDMESDTIDGLASALSTQSDLKPQQDFTAFHRKPFLRLDTGALICVNPGFVQEKLEVGLFWTIVNNLPEENRKKAFDTWGDLFQAYVNQTFEGAIDPAKENFIPFPGFTGKEHRHEAFDGILLSGRVCVVFEYKGGFLPNKVKYAENIDQFLMSLDQKFGAGPSGGVEQLVRKIAQSFAADKKEQRKLEGVDLSNVEIVVPALVVQDGFVSSFFTVPWLARIFRDSMRKKNLSRRVTWTSLLVLHVEDIENLYTYVKAGKFSLSECLLCAAKRGDPRAGRLFAFADILREFLEINKIDRVPVNDFDKKFEQVLNRLSLRLFNRKFERM